ncbi:MAG: N-6 DNA methylase, partial [Anaerolineales bacterium]|nr:N-6 DNA methylase [Anaerolineales bacterium]
MPLTFEESKDQVAALVRQFSLNRAAYLSPSYREAHARQEFIDKLFVALGWDVYNTQRAAPDYREVVFEDSLDVEGQKKSPDYVFRVGKDRKFFAEAKKPGVPLRTDAVPAYQLRRYAWSAKLALSVLTDFEELAVYDCRARPAPGDKPSVGRLNFITYDQYADRWRELWDVFSREAVWTGGFDAYAGTVGARRGASEVDAEFLKEIEGWRAALARNLALRNDLDRETLNDAVQRLIDRIIFLRMAEDRGIEDYGRLQRLAEGEHLHAGLARLARQADARYNSGLFDVTAPANKRLAGLALDDKALRPILAGLYYPESPYEFSVLPPEILGHVYEQFLGKVIRLTPGGHAKIEEKPEVKKAGGVYYTPTYIVNYIVQQTLGPQVAGKGPRELRGFRVLDPACGSGSFLLGAYQFLLDHYLAWYTAHDPERQRAAVWQSSEGWRLATAEKKRILTEHLFGVDIDRQAVEVTKLSLLLKVLENETDQSLARQLTLFDEAPRDRVLPNLNRNIKCGNSLIGPDYFTGP